MNSIGTVILAILIILAIGALWLMHQLFTGPYKNVRRSRWLYYQILLQRYAKHNDIYLNEWWLWLLLIAVAYGLIEIIFG